MLVHLKIMGGSQLFLALAHLAFPRRFNWKQEMQRLSTLNRQIFYVHCFFICWVLCLMGGLCLLRPEALLNGGELAQLVAAAGASFWFLRLIIQLFVYDSELWRGKAFETSVHYLFCFTWSYYTAVFVGVLVYLS